VISSWPGEVAEACFFLTRRNVSQSRFDILPNWISSESFSSVRLDWARGSARFRLRAPGAAASESPDTTNPYVLGASHLAQP
jgi:hypothetical protein